MEDTYKIHTRDLNWALGLNRFCLRLMGVWPDFRDVEQKPFNYVLPFMILAMFCFVFIPQMYALVLIKDNFLLVLDNVLTSCPALACGVKLFFLWSNKEVLRPVVESTIADWLRPKLKWERQIMINEASIAKILTIYGLAFVTCAHMGFIIAPIFGINIRIVTNITDYANRRLLFQSYYPYDYSTSPNFEMTYVSQLLGGLFISMSVAIPDNYFGAVVFHLCAQFKLLGLKIERFVRIRDESLTDSKNGLVKHLGVYVERHVHLIKMTFAVERSFNLQILAQLLIMGTMACCLGFRILYMLQNPNEKLPIFQFLNLIAALISLMLFMLADCSASEALTYHSSTIYNNLYNRKWYLVTEKPIISDLIIMMMMAKTHRSFTAGKIIQLSMLTYGQILKSIAGFVSVLIAASN